MRKNIIYFLTHFFFLLLCLMILFISGCSTTKKDIIYKKDIIVETIPDEFFQECKITAIIKKEDYVGMECPDRISYLTTYVTDLIFDFHECYKTLTVIKTYNEDMKKLYVEK